MTLPVPQVYRRVGRRQILTRLALWPVRLYTVSVAILLVLLSSQLITLNYDISSMIERENQKQENHKAYLKNYADKYNTPYEIIDHIITTSKKYDIDYKLILALIEVESQFVAHAKSSVGAFGYMQVRQIVLRDINRQDLDLYNPFDNIEAGILFFSELTTRYGYTTREALIHYNTGTKEDFRDKGIQYANRVLMLKSNI